jgi:rhodanese-related sulfurtransferase
MTSKIAMAVVAGILVSAGAQAAQPPCSSAERYPEVSQAELTQIVAKKSATVIDVNSAESYKDRHVPGALHFEANEKKLAQVLPPAKDAMIVAYCGGPKCTAWKKAAEAACALGYTNIRHFKGGISEWKKNEKPKPGSA